MLKQKPVLNRIKGALADAGVTNKQLASGIDVTEQTVSAWCTNAKQPPLPTLFSIADFLEVDVRDLLAPNNYARKEK